MSRHDWRPLSFSSTRAECWRCGGAERRWVHDGSGGARLEYRTPGGEWTTVEPPCMERSEDRNG